jgi:hypothetical protein
MAKYEVVKPWAFTVKAGDVIETDSLHPSLVPHVRKLPELVMEVATPVQRGRPRKEKEAE